MNETITWIDIDQRKPEKSGSYLVQLLPLAGYSDTTVIDVLVFLERFNRFDGGGAWPHFEDGCEIGYWAECPKGPGAAVENKEGE